MTPGRILIYLSLALFLVVNTTANATTVNATMMASVNNIFPNDPFGVSIGTQVVVNASYESSATDLVPQNPDLGRYALTSLSFTVAGGTPFVLTNGLEIETLVNQPSNLPNVDEFDRLNLSSGFSNVGGILNVRIIFARLVDFDSIFLASILPPTSLPDGVDFELATLRVGGANPGSESGGFEASIDNLTLSLVPAPAAVWLFGTALIGLIGFSKRKKAA